MRDWINKLLTRLRRPTSRAQPTEELFSPFTAAEDFHIGDRLSFYGDYLYRWDPGGQLPAAFIAGRKIKAGQRVISDPTDSRHSDLVIIWWEAKR